MAGPSLTPRCSSPTPCAPSTASWHACPPARRLPAWPPARSGTVCSAWTRTARPSRRCTRGPTRAHMPPRQSCAWDREVLDAIGLDPARLSPLGDTADAVAGLCPEWAARWPALAAVPWFPALGDGGCSNVGSGCVSPRRIALMVGTSGAIRVVGGTPDAPVVPGLWCYRVDSRWPLLGGALSEGGNLVAWMRATLQLDALPDLEAEVAAMPPDA